MPERLTGPFITHLTLKNIRSFPDLNLDFTHEGKPRKRTVIIGQNSTGKTTLLRSMVLALTDFIDASFLLGLPVGEFVAHNQLSATIGLEVGTLYTPISLEIKKEEDREYVYSVPGITKEAPLFMVGYGVSRTRTGKSQEVSRKYRISDAARTLFDVDAALSTPELSLRRIKDKLSSKRFEGILAGIHKALGFSPDQRISLQDGGGIALEGGPEGTLPLEGWADGHRYTFQWLVDVHSWALQYGQLKGNDPIQGVLMVDEIEQHLHPDLQTQLMQNLTELFPAMQIIATTHSPLVVMGVEPHEVVVLKKTDQGTVQLHEVPDFRNYSLEDVVENRNLFNTQVFTPHVQETLKQYERLAAIPLESRTKKDMLVLQQLSRELQPIKPQETEDPAIQELRAIRAALEKNKQ